MSPKYGNNTISDTKLYDQGYNLHACVPKIPVFSLPKISYEPNQHLLSQASYPTLLPKYMEIKDGQWATTESNAMKLCLSCPTFNNLSGSITVEKNAEKVPKESVTDCCIDFVGKYLHTMQKSSSSAVTAFNGESGQQDTTDRR